MKKLIIWMATILLCFNVVYAFDVDLNQDEINTLREMRFKLDSITHTRFYVSNYTVKVGLAWIERNSPHTIKLQWDRYNSLGVERTLPEHQQLLSSLTEAWLKNKIYSYKDYLKRYRKIQNENVEGRRNQQGSEGIITLR